MVQTAVLFVPLYETVIVILPCQQDVVLHRYVSFILLQTVTLYVVNFFHEIHS